VQESLPELKADQIENALDNVLKGHSFRSSPQCQALLRYIVENSVAHHDEMLRERMIGANVFGRRLDYDTGNDPIVRSRAAEVRKRLAQHYLGNEGALEAVRIDIPSGSYRAHFESPDSRGLGAHQEIYNSDANVGSLHEEVATASAGHPNKHHLLKENSATNTVIGSQPNSLHRPRSNWPRWTGSIVLALIVLLGAGLLTRYQVRSRHQRVSDLFWAPFINTQRPVLILIGSNHTYGLSNDFLDRYRAQHHLEYLGNGREFFIDLKKGDKLDESDLVPNNSLIGFGDVAAAARMASMLAKLNQNYDLRYGNDITVTDLRSVPTVFVGGFSNTWSLEVMRQLPFRLEGGDRIVESGKNSHSWIRKSDQENFKGDDYAVITRLIRSETGTSVLVIAGIDTYSNQAASDFLNDPDRLSELLRTLPKGWEQKNLQIVLHTTVIAQVPAVVNIEAVKVW